MGLRGTVASVAGCVVIAGCSLATPYQRFDGSLTSFGGYYDEPRGKDMYLVASHVNQFTSREVAEEYFVRRCLDVCRGNGYSNFEVVRHEDPPFHRPPNFHGYSGVIRCTK